MNETGFRKYGWRRDKPDKRDKYMSFSPLAVASIPSSIDLRPEMPAPYVQATLGSCHDYETEVLTESGWTKFANLDGTEKLATVNPLNYRLIFEKPNKIIRFNYSGEMYFAKNQSLDFAVTPDHKMLVRTFDNIYRRLNNNYVLLEMEKVGWYSGLLNHVVYDGIDDKDFYVLKGVEHNCRTDQRTESYICMETWLMFLGIYIAEGTMLKQQKHQMYKIQIAASKDREKSFIRNLFYKMNIKALELKDRFTFNNKQIYSAMIDLGLQGKKSYEKFVPRFIFNLPANKIEKFLLGHFMGDGCEQNGLKSYYTSSKQLADDLQRLILLAGEWSTIGIRTPRTSMIKGKQIKVNYPEYRVSQWVTKELSLSKGKYVKIKKYEGEVFCAEMPTYHTLITRRNNKILISGNCTAQAIAADCHYQMIKQKTNAWQPSALFIYYNERVIENTVKIDSGAELRDGMKAISRWGICSETCWKYDVSKFRNKPTQACYRQAAKHKIVDYKRIGQSLNQLKTTLATGDPFVFGFSVYESFESPEVKSSGRMTMPTKRENMLGGHAVCAVGFFDEQEVFIVRNSWGSDWGDKGYFYMPYSYITDPDLAADFWTVTFVPNK